MKGKSTKQLPRKYQVIARHAADFLAQLAKDQLSTVEAGGLRPETRATSREHVISIEVRWRTVERHIKNADKSRETFYWELGHSYYTGDMEELVERVRSNLAVRMSQQQLELLDCTFTKDASGSETRKFTLRFAVAPPAKSLHPTIKPQDPRRSLLGASGKGLTPHGIVYTSSSEGIGESADKRFDALRKVAVHA